MLSGKNAKRGYIYIYHHFNFYKQVTRAAVNFAHEIGLF